MHAAFDKMKKDIWKDEHMESRVPAVRSIGARGRMQYQRFQRGIPHSRDQQQEGDLRLRLVGRAGKIQKKEPETPAPKIDETKKENDDKDKEGNTAATVKSKTSTPEVKVRDKDDKESKPVTLTKYASATTDGKKGDSPKKETITYTQTKSLEPENLLVLENIPDLRDRLPMQQTAVSKIRRSIFKLPVSSQHTQYYPPDNDFRLESSYPPQEIRDAGHSGDNTDVVSESSSPKQTQQDAVKSVKKRQARGSRGGTHKTSVEESVESRTVIVRMNNSNFKNSEPA